MKICIINSSRRKGRTNKEKSDEQQKSEQSSDQTHYFTSFAFSKQMKNQINEYHLLLSDNVMALNMRLWKF